MLQLPQTLSQTIHVAVLTMSLSMTRKQMLIFMHCAIHVNVVRDKFANTISIYIETVMKSLTF